MSSMRSNTKHVHFDGRGSDDERDLKPGITLLEIRDRAHKRQVTGGTRRWEDKCGKAQQKEGQGLSEATIAVLPRPAQWSVSSLSTLF